MHARTSSRSLCRSSSVSPTIVITARMTAMSDTERPDFAASRMSPVNRESRHRDDEHRHQKHPMSHQSASDRKPLHP